jgi:hypothetical protein
MNKFTFGDMVRIRREAPHQLRPGEEASVFMVFLPPDRDGSYFDQFPPGVVYSVEFEDGASVDIHENWLEKHLQPQRRS